MDISNQLVRKQIISEINDHENNERRQESVKQQEVYRDNLLPYVSEYLRSFYSKQSFKELPIVASINLAKRISNQEASIYREPPKRTFTGVSEEQAKFLNEIYEEMMFDSKMLKSNRYYRLQQQSCVSIVPNMGKLKMRVLMNHHYDVIPSADDPTQAEAYILSAFDKSLFQPNLSAKQDEKDQSIGDDDDYRAKLKRYVWWTKDLNFITDDNGTLTSDPDNAINTIGEIPFVDIAADKDFEFWVRQGQSLTDFTIQFNASITDIGQVVRMQGFAQGVMTGSADSMPNNIQVGPMFVLKLPIDPNNPVPADFKFVSPNADIAGSLQYLETLLSNFLSSRGISPRLVTGKSDGDKFSSGIERLLAMVDLFEASKSDIAVYTYAEKKLFKIIKAYLNEYGGTDVLPGYSIGNIPDDADVEIEFKRPEMIQTESDKLALIEKKMDLGLIDKTDAIMIDRGFKKREDAEEVISKMEAMDGQAGGQDQIVADGSQSDNQP